MSNLTLCSCELAMHMLRGVYQCEHCDVPCEAEKGKCELCKKLRVIKNA